MARPTLSHCRELRELELYTARPTQVVESLITSITSTNLQKIVFSAQALPKWLADSDVARSRNVIDDSLCQLVDRLRRSGYERTLEVEFQTWELAEWEARSDFELLPKFREKGRVGITRTSVWRAAHSSDE